MPGIMSDADAALLGDSMEAGRLRAAFEAYIKHHQETEKELARLREENRKLLAWQADHLRCIEAFEKSNEETGE